MKNSIVVSAVAAVSLVAGFVLGGTRLTSAIAGPTQRTLPSPGSYEEYITNDSDGSSITVWTMESGKVTKAVKYARYNEGKIETTVYEVKKADGK